MPKKLTLLILVLMLVWVTSACAAGGADDLALELAEVRVQHAPHQLGGDRAVHRAHQRHPASGGRAERGDLPFRVDDRVIRISVHGARSAQARKCAPNMCAALACRL